MQLSRKLTIFSLAFLSFIIGSCQVSNSNNIRGVSPAIDVGYWALSPKGDKLIYNPNEKGVLLFPQSGKDYKFDCALRWLDNETLLCHHYQKSFIVTTDDLEKIPLEDVEATGVDPRSLLARAEKIYRINKPDALYFINRDTETNLVKGYAVNNLKNLESMLEDFDYISAPPFRPYGLPERRISSPNQVYYYNMPGESLTIYKTENDEKVAEYVTESPYFLAAEGWASDSSGVYFHVYGVAFASATAPKGIMKLIVSE